MGNDPLFTDLSEAIVYDRPGVGGLSWPSKQTVLWGWSMLPPVCRAWTERKKRKKGKNRSRRTASSVVDEVGESLIIARDIEHRSLSLSLSLSLSFSLFFWGWVRLGIRPSMFRVRFVSAFCAGSLRYRNRSTSFFSDTVGTRSFHSLVCQRRDNEASGLSETPASSKWVLTLSTCQQDGSWAAGGLHGYCLRLFAVQVLRHSNDLFTLLINRLFTVDRYNEDCQIVSINKIHDNVSHKFLRPSTTKWNWCLTV